MYNVYFEIKEIPDNQKHDLIKTRLSEPQTLNVFAQILSLYKKNYRVGRILKV